MVKNLLDKYRRTLKRASDGQFVKARLQRSQSKVTKYTLYLDWRKDGLKGAQFPGLFIFADKDKEADDLKAIKALLDLRAQKEDTIKALALGLDKRTIDRNLSEYLTEQAEGKQGYRVAMAKAFSELYPKLKTHDLTRSNCQKFANYLSRNFSPNSAKIYFSIFRSELKKLVIDDVLTKNPADSITVKGEESKREFLTVEEFKLLRVTPCQNVETKNAFIFSCLTGLRLSDLRALTFGQIKDGYIEFRQQKTGGLAKIMLAV